jgi:UDP-3-O-[3-hydroxymyristoyl] N-acetylglucosamine deacetylase
LKRSQQTIQKSFSHTGIGLHTGQDVTITCKPLPAGEGIKFKRVDLEDEPLIEADVENIVATTRCTTIGKNNNKINTVEHLMSVLKALQIDNLLIEVDAEEPPITDGSAKVFYELIKEAGIKEQAAEKQVYQIKEPIYVKEKNQYLVVLPSDEFRISYTFVSHHPGLEDQFCEFNFSHGNYFEQVAPARTFGFAKEVKKLQKAGFALGGSLDNAVLIDKDGPVKELRFADEIARHKILDIVGDMKLIPDFTGHIMAVRSGHKLNSVLANKINTKILKGELE